MKKYLLFTFFVGFLASVNLNAEPQSMTSLPLKLLSSTAVRNNMSILCSLNTKINLERGFALNSFFHVTYEQKGDEEIYTIMRISEYPDFHNVTQTGTCEFTVTYGPNINGGFAPKISEIFCSN